MPGCWQHKKNEDKPEEDHAAPAPAAAAEETVPAPAADDEIEEEDASNEDASNEDASNEDGSEGGGEDTAATPKKKKTAKGQQRLTGHTCLKCQNPYACGCQHTHLLFPQRALGKSTWAINRPICRKCLRSSARP